MKVVVSIIAAIAIISFLYWYFFNAQARPNLLATRQDVVQLAERIAVTTKKINEVSAELELALQPEATEYYARTQLAMAYPDEEILLL